uniref:Kinesin motor domain-containing protein n=1 Tax=Emiliania huxleyi (strain CCMP1516) TaxID=280463 RepID=A0A0D3KR07_EMIH1
MADRAFTFDHVFDTAAAQHEVYEGCAQALVERVLKGYNSTVLAYGQTGSGKTHTMGSIGTPSSAVPEAALGIIPRTVAEIFARVAGGDGELEGAALAASASFIEVYKEDIHDLLQPPIEAAAADGAPKLATLEVREKEGAIALPGLAMRPVGSPEEAMAVLSDGSSNRATGATAMNATSSRSHAIFTVSIELRLRGGKVLTPRFNFVDLAGSERAKRTGASGDRFAEGVQINKGLLALGNVISALCEKHAHVPYRDSKLTRLLQDSLGGNAHTLMIACVSPSDADMEETLNTLKYANRARQIQNKLLIAQDPVQARIADLLEQVETLIEC